MANLNYKHLHYFWCVAKEGSIAKASQLLHITPQTISGQISLLEEQLGTALFTKSGRNLELTDSGRLVLDYANEIFTIGKELEEVAKDLNDKRPAMFKVGILDAVPKSIVYQLLSPALNTPAARRIICHEGTMETLLLSLAAHKIDLVISDAPIPHHIDVKGYSHLLGESSLSFFASPELAAKLGKNFPANLNKAPMLTPATNSSLYSPLKQWFKEQNIQPTIVGEFEDTALMKAFGRTGHGVFAVPSILSADVIKDYNVEELGQIDHIKEQFYAISVERKIKHPAVLAVTEQAKLLME